MVHARLAAHVERGVNLQVLGQHEHHLARPASPCLFRAAPLSRSQVDVLPPCQLDVLVVVPCHGQLLFIKAARRADRGGGGDPLAAARARAQQHGAVNGTESLHTFKLCPSSPRGPGGRGVGVYLGMANPALQLKQKRGFSVHVSTSRAAVNVPPELMTLNQCFPWKRRDFTLAAETRRRAGEGTRSSMEISHTFGGCEHGDTTLWPSR
jgi:hypothetical protein